MTAEPQPTRPATDAGGLQPGTPGTDAEELTPGGPASAVPPQQTAPQQATPPSASTLPQHKIKRTRISGLWVSVGFFAVVLLLLLIFILQNGTKVDISYMGAHGHLPLGVALLLAAVCGVLLVVLAGAARISQLRTVARRHRRADAKRVTAAQAANGPPAPFAKALPAKDLRDPSCGLVQLVRGVRGVSQNDPGYPRPLTASAPAAQSSRSRRRRGASTTPVGNWCTGVSSTARRLPRARSSTRSP